MQLREDSWAFIYVLTNSHLFQQNLMSALHDNDVMLVLMLSQTVNNVQPTAARRSGRFNKMHGALRALQCL